MAWCAKRTAFHRGAKRRSLKKEVVAAGRIMRHRGRARRASIKERRCMCAYLEMAGASNRFLSVDAVAAEISIVLAARATAFVGGAPSEIRNEASMTSLRRTLA